MDDQADRPSAPIARYCASAFRKTVGAPWAQRFPSKMDEKSDELARTVGDGPSYVAIIEKVY